MAHPHAIDWPADVAAIVAADAARAYPDECCGLLLGHADGRITAAAPVPNGETDERRRVAYLLSPGAYRRAEQQARAAGLEVVGVFHSHPDHPAEPSPSDLAEAWPGWLYVIVPVAQGRPGAPRGWRLRADRSGFDPVALPTLCKEIVVAHVVHIPTPLRAFTDKRDTVEVEGATVGDALASLVTAFPELQRHLYNEQGKLRHFVNIYVNDDDIRYLEKEATPLAAGDSLSIIPSVAGGSGATDVAEPTLPALEHDEFQRYSRHLILPEVGLEGQRRLKAASVLCIGAGGLGSPALLYLAAAGIGRLGIVDFDVVDVSNLQRQVIHGTPDVGRPKLESARDRVLEINPHAKVELHEVALSSQNALDLFKDYDVIVDGTDNFPTRYLVNDACVLLGKPNAYGSIFRFEGQASVFATKGGPCYRCLYPEPPPPGLVPSCAEGGVLGVLPGIIGVIQATEAIKLILGAGEPLIGRFLIYDALRMRFRELKLRRDPECPVCGDHPTVTTLIDYEQFCGLKPEPTAATGTAAAPAAAEIPVVTVEELKARLDASDELFVLDVREHHEVEICRIAGTTVIPLGELPSRLGELPRDRDIVVHCKMGGRSAKAVGLMRDAGFDRAANLTGGILAWIDRIDPSQPKY